MPRAATSAAVHCWGSVCDPGESLQLSCVYTAHAHHATILSQQGHLVFVFQPSQALVPKYVCHGFSRNTRHKLLYLFWREGIAGRQVSCAAVLLQKGTGARCRCHSSSPSCSSAGHGAEEVAGVQRPARVNTGIRLCQFLPSPQGHGCRSLASSSKREQTSNLGLLFSPFTRLQSKTSMMLHSVVKDLQ